LPPYCFAFELAGIDIAPRIIWADGLFRVRVRGAPRIRLSMVRDAGRGISA